MKLRSSSATPGDRAAQLAVGLRDAKAARSLDALKSICVRYGLSYESSGLSTAKKEVEQKLQDLLSNQLSDDAPISVPVGEEGISPVRSKHLSYSQAVRDESKNGMTPVGRVPQSRVFAAAKEPEQRSLMSVIKASDPARVALQKAGGAPSSGPPRGEQREVPAAAQPLSAAASSEREADLAQLVASLQSRLSAVEAKLAATQAQVARLQEQQRASHGVGLAAQQTACALQQSMADEAAAHRKLKQQVDKLEVRQQGAQQQRELAECQQSVVLALPSPLPDSQRAVEVQTQLANLLDVHVKVVRVQPMGKPSSGSSSEGQRGKHSYKVQLASREQRAAVLSSKQEHMPNLQAADVSIRGLLTSAQQATKKGLFPVAQAAKQAGSQVDWRRERLFINGKEHNGSASLPQPRQQQQQQAQPGAQQQRMSQPEAQQRAEGNPMEEKEEGEWQQPKPKKGHKGSTAAAKPKQAQQQGNSRKAKPMAGEQESSSTAAAKPGKATGSPTSKGKGLAASKSSTSAPTAPHPNSSGGQKRRQGGNSASGSGAAALGGGGTSPSPTASSSEPCA